MALNLSKHGSEMQRAWKQVCDANESTDWALYGYEGNTFDLKLISTGEDGIEEMIEELNANKILYAFIKVVDPKTSLPKFVFLHWQGESALATRKGKAATHVRDVQKYFHGHHITINARSEDEVCIDDILEKVSKASASKFNFNVKPTTMESAPAPVGTSHQRIIPKNELPNMDEREKFWNTEESKEKERKDDERIRKISEYKQIDAERRAREEAETKARENMVREREKKISHIRDSELTSGSSNDDEKRAWEQQQALDHQEEMDRQNRGKELQRKRSEEARQLISQRSTNEARSVFERNSSVGQMNYRKPSYPTPNPIPEQTIETQRPTPSSVSTRPASTSAAPPHQINAAPTASNNISISHSNGGGRVSETVRNRFEEPWESVNGKEATKNDVRTVNNSNKRIKEVEEQANMVNANEVSTEDIVVPPPESFGNDDNHRALAAAAVQYDDQNQHLNNHQSQRKQHHDTSSSNPVKVLGNAMNQIIPPPDVTNQTNDMKPDLIQDVAATQEQPDLTRNGGHELNNVVGAGNGEPEKSQIVATEPEQVKNNDYGQCALALYDYQAADDTEISFDPGQVITHIDQIDPGWWQGLGPDGNFGLFPANYVEIIDPRELARAEELTA